MNKAGGWSPVEIGLSLSIQTSLTDDLNRREFLKLICSKLAFLSRPVNELEKS